MNIKRTTSKELINWKYRHNRNPLVVQGAPEVGKTWLLKHFGAEEVEDTAYFNFEEYPDLKQFFENTKDVYRIVDQLALVHGRPIIADKTLIIFDEIQECNDALNALKYFCENAPEYAVVGAGSLLGVVMAKGDSFPVGKVDFLYVHPVSFSEFLATEDRQLFAFLESLDGKSPIPDIFFNPLVDKLKKFFICGGMPEAVATLVGEQDVEKTQQVLQNIANAYALDFSKYAEN